MKSYTELEIKAIFKEQGYKFCSLKDADGKSIVPYNTAKGKETATDKLNEAFKRLKIISDGFYTFCFLNSMGRNVKADEYGFLKGSLSETETKGHQVHIINQKSNSDFDKVLSYSEVLNLKSDLLRAELLCENFKTQNVELEKQITELEEELKALNEKPLEENKTNANEWVQTTATTLLPILDRWLSIREKEVDKKPTQQRRVRTVTTLPKIGTSDWNSWLDKLENYNDEQFEKALSFIKSKSMEHYNNVVDEFSEVETDTQNTGTDGN